MCGSSFFLSTASRTKSWARSRTRRAGWSSSLFVDEGAATDLRRFPEKAGLLDPGNEGVIVADVDLGFEVNPVVGLSTPYGSAGPPIKPFAAASLVYQRHPYEQSYAGLLATIDELAADKRDDSPLPSDIHGLVKNSHEVLQNAASLLGRQTRKRRLDKLNRELRHVNLLGELRQSIREVVLPPEALPLTDLRAVMALGCADVIDSWTREVRNRDLRDVEERLHSAAAPIEKLEAAHWSEPARTAVAELRARFDDLKSHAAQPQVVHRVELPKELSLASLPNHESDGIALFWGQSAEEARRKMDDDGEQREREKKKRTRSAKPSESRPDELGPLHVEVVIPPLPTPIPETAMRMTRLLSLAEGHLHLPA